MSNNYSTTKDLGKAVAILVFMMVGVPMLIEMIFGMIFLAIPVIYSESGH